MRHNIMVIYHRPSNFTNTVMDYLRAFGQFSKFNVHYMPATPYVVPALSLEHFDAVIVFYSIAVFFQNLKAPLWQALAEYSGIKMVIQQDEYDHLQTSPQGFAKIGADIIVTNMPRGYERVVYNADILPDVSFVQALTGYVPDNLVGLSSRPLRERKWVLGYRGRPLPYRYGRLGWEKMRIGQVMRRICAERGLPVNIAWGEADRIYGAAWPDFLQNCRATLGTESGSEVFDFTGALQARIDGYLKKHPAAEFEEIYGVFLKDLDGQVPMRQISPKVFEAICLRTALVLFEGDYSRVLTPWAHYIPLKKDFSNADEVLARVQDDAFLSQLTERAYADIIESGRYAYKNFIETLDGEMEKLIGATPVRAEILSVVVGVNKLNFDKKYNPDLSTCGVASLPGNYLNFETRKNRCGDIFYCQRNTIRVKIYDTAQNYIYPYLPVSLITRIINSGYGCFRNSFLGRRIVLALKRVPGAEYLRHLIFH